MTSRWRTRDPTSSGRGRPSWDFSRDLCDEKGSGVLLWVRNGSTVMLTLWEGGRAWVYKGRFWFIVTRSKRSLSPFPRPLPTCPLPPEIHSPLSCIIFSPQLLPVSDIHSDLLVYLVHCLSPPLECELYENLYFVPFIHNGCVSSA